MSAIADRIKRLRIGMGLTQRDIAGEAMTAAYISRIEAGERTPSFEALILLAEQLGTTGLELFTGVHTERCPFCRRGAHAPR